jgi:methyl-accepting chemotaxis protein
VLLDEVNRASKEQLKGANQINQAVTQINTIVQTTASSSEENASAGEELQSQAELLAQNVVSLSGIINGRKRGAEQRPADRPVRYAPAPERKSVGRVLPPAPARTPGIELTRPEDVIPLKDFKDF